MTHDNSHLHSFTVDRCIGQGGMGSVYRGKHVDTGVPVALKVIRGAVGDDKRHRFHQEVESHASLTHPGIVYLFDYGILTDDQTRGFDEKLAANSPFVVMEYAEQGTVRDLLPLSDWATAHRILVQILDALAHAHAREIIHRDLKPENFLLCARDDRHWQVKLADFGIAHAIGREAGKDPEILESSVGTPYYMSPEQIHGEWRNYGPWTDLYALGCIAWELVCGNRPFTGQTPFMIAMAHCRGDRPSLDPAFPVPQTLESWIYRAMAIDQNRRFQRAADAASALPPAPDEVSGIPIVNNTATADPSVLDDDSVALAPTLAFSQRTEFNARTEIAEKGTVRGADKDVTTELRDVTDGRGEPPASTTSTSTLATITDDDYCGPVTESELRVDSWKTGRIEQLPAPLVGAGLGLFGLREPPFVGRETLRHQLWEILLEVIDRETTKLTFIAGQAGVGKSRLANWLVTRAHEVGAASVLKAVHTPGGGGVSEGLSGLVRRAFRTWKLSRGELFKYLLDQLPDIPGDNADRRQSDARALTELIRPTSADDQHVDGPSFTFRNSRHKYALLTRLFRRMARHKPLVVWLDDVQWSQQALGLIEYLQKSAQTLPPMYLVVTMRSDIVAETPHLADRIQKISTHVISNRVELQALPRRDHRRMLERLLPLDPQLCDQLVDRTEGNPLFAVQLLSDWVERDHIRIGKRGFALSDGFEPRVPDDIHTLWLDRIAQLVTDSKDRTDKTVWVAFELAAALGRVVDRREWQTVCNRAGIENPAELLDRLVQRGLARRTDDNWRFTHGLLVDSLARHARDRNRWKEHNEVCAQMLEQFYDNRWKTAEQRADHWIEAGRGERALDSLLQAARAALRSGDEDRRTAVLERRQRLLDELDIPPDSPRRLENNLELGLLYYYTAKTRRAERLAHKTNDQLDEKVSMLNVRTAQVFGMCYRRRGMIEEARRWLQKGRNWARDLGETRSHGILSQELCWLELFQGNLDRVDAYYSESMDCIQQIGDKHWQAWGLLYMASVAWMRGHERYATRLYRHIIELGEQREWRLVEAYGWQGLGMKARFDGDFEQARLHYRRFRNCARSQDHGLACVEMEFAMVEVAAGNFADCRRHLERARQLFEEMSAQKFMEWLDVIALALAAGTEDWQALDAIFRPYKDGWPSDGHLSREHPWHLQMAGDYAEDNGSHRRARQLWEVASRLWGQLGDKDAAARLKANIERHHS